MEGDIAFDAVDVGLLGTDGVVFERMASLRQAQCRRELGRAVS
jgi:hypothetical protein